MLNNLAASRRPPSRRRFSAAEMRYVFCPRTARENDTARPDGRQDRRPRHGWACSIAVKCHCAPCSWRALCSARRRRWHHAFSSALSKDSSSALVAARESATNLKKISAPTTGTAHAIAIRHPLMTSSVLARFIGGAKSDQRLLGKDILGGSSGNPGMRTGGVQAPDKPARPLFLLERVDPRRWAPKISRTDRRKNGGMAVESPVSRDLRGRFSSQSDAADGPRTTDWTVGPTQPRVCLQALRLWTDSR